MTALRDAFESQSRGCEKLGSPFMARLMALCADRLEPGDPISDRLLSWPGNVSSNGQSVPLRLAGALHALCRAGHGGLSAVYPPQEAEDEALWAAVRLAFETDAGFLMTRLDSPPQTNEVRRSAAVIPAMHMLSAWVPHPMHMLEIGCSAGLNLRADRFALAAGKTRYGPPDAPVRLTPDWTGPAPVPGHVRVRDRIGVDLNPLDPMKDRDRLMSYLWPDQPDRIGLTEAAIVVAEQHPATIVRADVLDWLPGALEPCPGILRLLFHTIAWQYLPPSAQAAGNRIIAEVGEAATLDAPLARLSVEAAGPHAAITLQIWPGGRMFDLGRADYHGRWVHWELDRLPEGRA